jgi:hypothetical protein
VTEKSTSRKESPSPVAFRKLPYASSRQRDAARGDDPPKPEGQRALDRSAMRSDLLDVMRFSTQVAILGDEKKNVLYDGISEVAQVVFAR